LPLTASSPHLSLGGSEYLATVHGKVAGKPPVVDFDLERRVQAVTREGIRQGWVRSAHDCAEGGLAVALAESCIASQLGAVIDLGLIQEFLGRWDEVLFGESASRIVVSVRREDQPMWESHLKEQLGQAGEKNNWQEIGLVSQQNLKIMIANNQPEPLIEASLSQMSDRYSLAIERRLTV